MMLSGLPFVCVSQLLGGPAWSSTACHRVTALLLCSTSTCFVSHSTIILLTGGMVGQGACIYLPAACLPNSWRWFEMDRGTQQYSLDGDGERIRVHVYSLVFDVVLLYYHIVIYYCLQTAVVRLWIWNRIQV